MATTFEGKHDGNIADLGIKQESWDEKRARRKAEREKRKRKQRKRMKKVKLVNDEIETETSAKITNPTSPVPDEIVASKEENSEIIEAMLQSKGTEFEKPVVEFSVKESEDDAIHNEDSKEQTPFTDVRVIVKEGEPVDVETEAVEEPVYPIDEEGIRKDEKDENEEEQEDKENEELEEEADQDDATNEQEELNDQSEEEEEEEDIQEPASWYQRLGSSLWSIYSGEEEQYDTNVVENEAGGKADVMMSQDGVDDLETESGVKDSGEQSNDEPNIEEAQLELESNVLESSSDEETKDVKESKDNDKQADNELTKEAGQGQKDDVDLLDKNAKTQKVNDESVEDNDQENELVQEKGQDTSYNGY